MPLVGRDRQAAVLQAEVNRTLDSHGGLVFVTGEAGIGKTALVAEAAEAASQAGALVANGTCWDREGAPGFWPWVQVLRSLQRATDPEAWDDARLAAGSELDLLLGEVEDLWRPNPVGDTGFGLSDAVMTLLVTLSRRHPVVVVLDDLHWSDSASIRLLEFVARHAWFEQLLVIGTYRDVEVEAAGHPLGPDLLPLVAKATRVSLAGLDREAVGHLLARAAGRQPGEEMVAEVHRRTGGNPFFVDQTAQLWHTTNSVDAIAPGVRDAVERRLGLLPEPVLDLLTAAAVLGPVVERGPLEASAGLTGREADRLLAEAASARLLIPAPGDGEPGGRQGHSHSHHGTGDGSQGRRWAFVHDLVRETLYDRLEEAEARKRHAAVVQAMSVPGAVSDASGEAEGRPAALAHHAYLAVPEVAPEDAVIWLKEAAQHAWGRLAVDEAHGHLDRARELMPAHALRERAAIALELGSAQHHLGDLVACRQSFEEVAGLARKLDDPVLLARAALRLRMSVWLVYSEEMAELAISLINEAHAKLIGDHPSADDDLSPGHRPAERKTDLEREQELSARAVELARASGDDEALMDSLAARYDAIWAPGTAAERERLADEMARAAQRQRDRSFVLMVSMLRLLAHLEQGVPGWAGELDAVVSEAEAMRSAFSRSCALWMKAFAATFTGRFDEARSHLQESESLDAQVGAARDGPNDFTVIRLQQWWLVELMQGRFDRAEVWVGRAREAGHPFPELLDAVIAVEQGDAQAGRHALDQMAVADEQLARWFAPLRLRLQAQVAAAARDPQPCDRVRVELAPLAGQWAVMFGEAPHGPMMLWSALVDAAQERWDQAIDGFAAAAEAANLMQARPWAVEARSRLAEALLGRSASDDAEAAAVLLDEVERDATALGMVHVVERARKARSGWQVPAPVSPARAPGGDGEANVFRLDGQVWTLRYGGRTVHLPDAKGLHDLHVLLGLPGTDVRSVELAHPEGGEVAVAASRLGGDPVLDERARAAYRKRLTLLDEEIDRAVVRGRDGRAAQLDQEREALIQELRRATGLGGRSRRLGDQAEKARKAVSERIRDTLRRLDKTHPALAEHLRASVSTGASCRYQPPDTVTWDL